MRKKKPGPIFMCPLCDEWWPREEEGGYSWFFSMMMSGAKRREHADVKLCRDILAKKYRTLQGELSKAEGENAWFRNLFEPKKEESR